MSDRSALSIRIYQADPAKAEQLKAYIVDEWSPSEGTDLLKDLFVVLEVSLGSADGVHDDLIQIDNTAVFAVWQDPKYEFMGDLVMHHPALGTFSAESDAAGSPRPSYEKVVALGVETAFGRAWFDAIAAIEPFGTVGDEPAMPPYLANRPDHVDHTQAWNALRAAERGGPPVIMKVTGPNSLLTPGPDPEEDNSP